MKKLNLLIIIALVLGVSMQVSAVITHRYDFAVDANDVVGGLESTLIGDAVVTGGSLVLDGTDDWMEMPGDQIAVNTYDAVSLEMWYTPVDAGNASWSMLAYLGGNNASATWMGIDYIFMTSARDDDKSRAAISVGDTSAPWDDESGADGPEYDDGLLHHMVATFDADNVTLNIDGQFISSAPMDDETLSGVSQDLAYLGKGGYLNDPEWNGSIHEFRIYDKALDPGEVAFTYHFGADDPYAIALRSKLPIYGDATLVADDSIVLSWTPEPWVDAGATYYLYLGSDPNIADPNKLDVSGISDLVQTDLTTPGYTITGGTLGYQTNYYWRVDTVQEDLTEYQGAPSMFTTLPDNPFFVDPVPGIVIADVNDTVTLTVNAANTNTYKWYKESDPGTTLSATDTLVISDVTVTDEDNYLCDISHTDAPAVIVTSDPIRVIARRLMGHWKFEANLLDSVQDTVAGAPVHDGVLTVHDTIAGPGDPNYASEISETGIDGDAAWFYSDGDFVVISDSVDYFNYYHEGFTMSCWYLMDQLAGWTHPIIKLEPGNADASGYLFGVDGNSRKANVFIFENALGWPGLNSDDGDNDVDYTDGNWHMMTATYDASTNTAYLYADGVLVDQGTPNFDALGYPNATLKLGGSNLDGNPSIQGGLDDVRIYSYPLSEVEVAELYTTTTPEADYICLEEAGTPLEYDFNGDCRVNLADLLEVINQWLECPRIPASACFE